MNGYERSGASTVFAVFGSLCAAGLAVMVWLGRSYYFLPAAQRPLNDLHSALRPSGSLGLGYGVAGLALIILNLAYLVRSTHVRWEWMGSQRSWLSMHVFTGIAGGLFVLLHSAFHLRNPMAALAAVSMLIVVATGVVGRFIYTRVPRSPQGRELELGELEKAVRKLHDELDRNGMPLEDDPGGAASESHRSVLAALAGLLSSDHADEREYERLHRAVLASPRMAASAAGILPLARLYVREKSWRARYHELRELMRGWRAFHRWFSILMIFLAVLHVLVATNLGGLGFSAP